MDGPMRMLPDWLMPDAQPGDWYQWTVVAAGHAMLGIVAFVPLRLLVGARGAWVICLTVYAAIELLQLTLGAGDALDGLTDALFVVGGMMMASEAVKREPRGFSLVVAFMAAAAMVGIWIRL